MDDSHIAALVAIILSALLVFIEISRSSKVAPRNLANFHTLMYFLMAAIGNVFTTYIASASASDQIPPSMPRWFAFAFLGVFGFEAILKNINLSFAGRGVLSINDWINKAKDSAVAAAVELNVQYNYRLANTLAQELAQIDEETLNAHAITLLGPEQLQSLEKIASESKANLKLMKALAMAKKDYTAATAIISKN